MNKVESRLDNLKDFPLRRIPKEWEVHSVEEVLHSLIDFRGRTPKKIGMDWGGGEIPALSANNVEMGKINLAKETYYGSERLYERWMNNRDPERGDIVMTLEAPLGNVAQIPDERKYILSQRVVLLKTKRDLICNDFLKHQLMAHCFQSLLLKNATGTTAKGIQQSKLLRLPITLPSLSEQRRIAEILDAVDTAIQQADTLIAKLKQIKAGLLHDLLTRGLDERGQLRDPIRHPEQFKDSPLGRMPKEWGCPSFEAVTPEDAPICYGIVQPGPYVETGVPVLAIHNLNGGYLTNIHRSAEMIERRYTRSRVLPNDVLLSVKGTIGRVGVVPSWFVGNISRDIARIRLTASALPQYVRQMLLAPSSQCRLELAVVGTTRPEVSIGILKKLLLLLPPWEEQERIAEALDVHDTCIRAEEAYRDKLKQLKRGLVDDLLIGRVRGSDDKRAA